MIVGRDPSDVVYGVLLMGSGAMMTASMTPVAVVTMMLMMRGSVRLMLM
jgi:hypothetical protein